jgi:YesN/AraC family two-component response regulator
MGISPISYVYELRIKKAKEMLKSDYSSIADIAQSLGYLSIYDFSKAFKKYTGVSPLKYAKQLSDK